MIRTLEPYVPDGWTVAHHVTVEMDLSNLSCVMHYCAPSQLKPAGAKRRELDNELHDILLLDATLLDDCLANSLLIPESWKEYKYLFFRGTIYRDAHGEECVRCLEWKGSEWGWTFRYIDLEWFEVHPVAVLTR